MTRETQDSQKRQNKSEKFIFANFQEYWKLTKSLNQNQRDIIFSNLSSKQRKVIKQSFKNGGWQDLIMRNQIDQISDMIKQNYNIDLIYIKTKVSNGQSYYINKNTWNMISNIFKNYQKKHVQYIIGSIQAQAIDQKTVLLTIRTKGTK